MHYIRSNPPFTNEMFSMKVWDVERGLYVAKSFRDVKKLVRYIIEDRPILLNIGKPMTDAVSLEMCNEFIGRYGKLPFFLTKENIREYIPDIYLRDESQIFDPQHCSL